MPTIDLTEVANGVSEILNARARGAQLISEQAKRLADEQAQRESEQAAKAQRVDIEKQWSEILVRLTDVTRRRASSLVSGNLHRVRPDEWACLEHEYTNVMREKLNLQDRFPFLKG